MINISCSDFISCFRLNILPMPKRDWNDINDEDSSLSSQEQEVVEAPIVEKRVTVTSTNGTSRLKNACDQMSLVKLEGLQRREVWLYVPNSYYESADEVNDILEKNSDLKKVSRIKNIGWNVQTDKQNARKLISDGLSTRGIFIKFIFSNKNDEDKGTKLQKKVTYVEKAIKPLYPQLQKSDSYYSEANGNKQPSIVDQMIAKDKIEEREKESEKDKADKKKVKWMEKPKSLNIDEIKSFNSRDQIKSPKTAKTFQDLRDIKSPQRQVRSPRNNRDMQSIKSPKKYVMKEDLIPKTQVKSQEYLPSIEEKVSIIPAANEQKTVPQEPIIIEQNEVEQKMQIQSPRDQTKVQLDEEQSNGSLQKELKKKKKKRKPKSKAPKPQKIDNNPFSYFIKG